ncbi:MAG TPA: hypothetical protein VJA26_05625 [Gammaproteobacteria bacterium]|nr:hypothetical protein [Gammaproteobacteria bacterium]
MAATLTNLEDAESGQPVVQEIIRLDSEPKGSRSDYLPDLLVVWRRDRPIRSIRIPGSGVVRGPTFRDALGNHVPGGVFYAAGPGIDHHGLPDEPIPASIVDLAPTICALFGLRLPDCAGTPITAIAGTRMGNPTN